MTCRAAPATLLLSILLACSNAPKESGLEDTAAADQDQDGFGEILDCDDLNAAIFPGAPETCDGIDNDCDEEVDEGVTTTWYQDADLDGYGSPDVTSESCEPDEGFTDNSDDCNDEDATAYAGAEETCDGVDNNCDGTIDEDEAIDALTWYADTDGDGWGTDALTEIDCDAPAGYVLHGGDCDDANPSYHPGALENVCTDSNDYNCDGSVGYADADGDGYAACDDCDDNDATANDAGIEVCDGADNDCDGSVDEDDATDATTWYGDADLDGYGGTQFQQDACTAPANFVANADDCDDLDPTSYPGAAEICDEADNDCDGTADEGVELTFYADADGDGYGDSSQSYQACSEPPGYSSNGDDCDDSAATSSPAALEICDSIDNDCDGDIDEADAVNTTTWYRDADADGYGDPNNTVIHCTQPTGFVIDNQDCDDFNNQVHPTGVESCDSIDNNCNGTIDEAESVDAATWYRDADGDGYGLVSNAVTACEAPSDYIAQSGDCDDTDAATNPAAAEACDGADRDCDGSVDNDADRDGYSDFTCGGSDCDDGDTSYHPSAPSACDGTDRNCDGSVDNDTDGDGYSDLGCGGSDCNDGDSSYYPGAPEACDGTDRNCDGSVDNDTDGDSYASYICGGTDCNDLDTTFYPGAPEACNGTDQDCDGIVDNDLDSDGASAQSCGGTDCNDGDPAVTLCLAGTSCTAHSQCDSGYCGPGSAVCIDLSEIVISGLVNPRDANMGGIAGANDKCETDAQNAGVAGTWVAFLSDSTQDLIDIIPDSQDGNGFRLRATIPINNLLGQPIVANWDAVGDGSTVTLMNYVYALDLDEMDECCGFAPDADAWTGTGLDGTALTGQHCNDWNTTSGNGVATELDVLLLLRQEIDHSCNETLGVMCVRIEP